MSRCVFSRLGKSLSWSLFILSHSVSLAFLVHLSFSSYLKCFKEHLFHKCNIAKNRKILTENDAYQKKVLRLDYCNSLLTGGLQMMQNAVARVPGMSKRDCISAVLAPLHWLSVKSRIDFSKPLLNYSPSYLERVIAPYHPNRMLCSQSAYLWFQRFLKVQEVIELRPLV